MNFMEAVKDAVCLSASVLSQQQLSDGDSTLLDLNMEQKVYDDEGAIVNKAAAWVKTASDELDQHRGDPDYQNQLTKAQVDFQNDETQMQTDTQQADGGTQAEQNQVGQDSSNAQNKIQLEAAVNQVMQSLSSALGQNY